ncbi:MAG: hypothetical protein RLZZ408_966 [Verrucomicrobiota bacterium]
MPDVFTKAKRSGSKRRGLGEESEIGDGSWAERGYDTHPDCVA